MNEVDAEIMRLMAKAELTKAENTRLHLLLGPASDSEDPGDPIRRLLQPLVRRVHRLAVEFGYKGPGFETVRRAAQDTE